MKDLIMLMNISVRHCHYSIHDPCYARSNLDFAALSVHPTPYYLLPDHALLLSWMLEIEERRVGHVRSKGIDLIFTTIANDSVYC